MPYLKDIALLTETHPQGKSIDLNLVYLLLANRAFARADAGSRIKILSSFNKENFAASRDKYEYLEKTFFLNQLKDLCVTLYCQANKQRPLTWQRNSRKTMKKPLSIFSWLKNLYKKQNDPGAFVYLDSVFSKSKNIDFSQFNFDRPRDFRYNLILLMSRIGGRKLNDLSNNFSVRNN